jgi:hypothetical protein
MVGEGMALDQVGARSVTPEEQVEAAYRRMAREARYRPAAPSDGLGNITVPSAELDLDAEARQYAAQWQEQEDTGVFALGCANWSERRAMVFALEAARLCCSGFDGPVYARRLLRLALKEMGA